MPVEIEEVVIRAKIAQHDKDKQSLVDCIGERSRLVQDCVDEVVRIMQAKQRP